MKQRLVLIGNGMAGARALEQSLQRGGRDQFQISVFGQEPYGTYDRMQLPEVIAGVRSANDILLNSEDWYRSHGIRLHAGERALIISREAKRVYGSKGSMEHYDRLIFATGSDPYVPPIPGLIGPTRALRDGISAFRTLDDCSRIVLRAAGKARVAVLGGGLLALEAVRGLLARGCDIHLIHRGKRLLADQLDDEGARELQALLEKQGVRISLSQSVKRVYGADAVEGVELTDGSSVACELIVLAMGLQPNSWIAAQCGLTVSRAIVVDDHMRSIDDDSIYALGECAEHRGDVSTLLEPIDEQARVLASHLTGSDPKAAFHGAKRATHLRLMGAEVASFGLLEPESPTDRVIRIPAPTGRYKKLIVRGNRLLGAMVVGCAEDVAFYRRLFQSASADVSTATADLQSVINAA